LNARPARARDRRQQRGGGARAVVAAHRVGHRVDAVHLASAHVHAAGEWRHAL